MMEDTTDLELAYTTVQELLDTLEGADADTVTIVTEDPKYGVFVTTDAAIIAFLMEVFEGSDGGT